MKKMVFESKNSMLLVVFFILFSGNHSFGSPISSLKIISNNPFIAQMDSIGKSIQGSKSVMNIVRARKVHEKICHYYERGEKAEKILSMGNEFLKRYPDFPQTLEIVHIMCDTFQNNPTLLESSQAYRKMAAALGEQISIHERKFQISKKLLAPTIPTEPYSSLKDHNSPTLDQKKNTTNSYSEITSPGKLLSDTASVQLSESKADVGDANKSNMSVISKANSSDLSASLKMSTDCSKLGASYYHPDVIYLVADEPDEDWDLPGRRGNLRLYGTRWFCQTHFKVAVDYISDEDVRIYFCSGDEGRFTSLLTKNKQRHEIKFMVKYSDSVQPYVMELAFRNYSNKYSIGIHRDSVRYGYLPTANGRTRIVLSDDNCDGDYSDSKTHILGIDLNNDGVYDRDEDFASIASPLMIDGEYYTAKVEQDGSFLMLTPSGFGYLTGKVSSDKDDIPIQNAKIKTIPYGIEAMSDSQGKFKMRLPEGKYWRLQVAANGHLPFQLSSPDTVMANRQQTTKEIYLKKSNLRRQGKIRMKSSRGYHFLAGKEHGVSDGDFYYSFSRKEPVFYANNSLQGGVTDLGLVSNPLRKVIPPKKGYSRQRVKAIKGHTYVSKAKEGEENCYIIFKVIETGNGEYVDIEYYYKDMNKSI